MNEYHDKILIPFVDILVQDHMGLIDGEYEVDFNTIPQDEKELFASHLLKNDDDDLSCIVDCDEHKEIGAILSVVLKRCNIENKLDFAELVVEKVVNYYKNRMMSLIEERLNIIKINYDNKTCIVSYR